MNIVSDKPIKITYTICGDTKLHTDYLLKGRSIINNYDYTEANIDVKSIEYTVNKYELKYFKKKGKIINIANANSISEYFTLARALNVDIESFLSRDEKILSAAYRKKLISFLKNSYCKNRFSEEIEKNILSIKDTSVLLQYLPLDTFYRDNNISKKYYYIHNIRVKLYYILFPNQQEFIELFDKEFAWVTECLKTFEIPELKFFKFNQENETIMKPMRKLWHILIGETYERAKLLLHEEETSALKFSDTETLQEIELIKKELDKTFNELNLDTFKTPRALLHFWPDIFAPGPSLLYPY